MIGSHGYEFDLSGIRILKNSLCVFRKRWPTDGPTSASKVWQGSRPPITSSSDVKKVAVMSHDRYNSVLTPDKPLVSWCYRFRWFRSVILQRFMIANDSIHSVLHRSYPFSYPELDSTWSSTARVHIYEFKAGEFNRHERFLVLTSWFSTTSALI